MKRLLCVLVALVLALASAGVSLASTPVRADSGTINETAEYKPVNVAIISPSAESISGDALLISVKISHGVYSSYTPTAVRVSVDRVETKTLSKDETEEVLTPVREPVVKDSGKAWYYTERLEGLEPGVYRVTVEAKNAYANEKGDYFEAAAVTVTLTKKADDKKAAVIEPEKVEPKETKEATGLKKIVEIIKNLFK